MDRQLTGTVENVVYRNTESGFCVLDLALSAKELVTVVGELYDVCEGEQLTVYGEFVTHPSFGAQFKATAAEHVLPKTATAIEKYLSDGAIEGIGPVLAKRLVAEFKNNTLEVMARQPELLSQVKGISPKKAAEINKRFMRIYGMRETLSGLAAYGIEAADAIALFKTFADAAVQVISSNPYMLCGYPLYKPFDFADALASQGGVDAADPKRVLAGYIYALRHNTENGHTCLPTEKLIDITADYLSIDRDAAEIALFDFIEQGRLKTAEINSQSRVFMLDCYAAEKYAAERIRLLKELSFEDEFDGERLLSEFEQKNEIKYQSLQREAVLSAMCEGAVVITGGPGTGKTTAVNAIISLCEQLGQKVALAAPTGRAAKRMGELTGREAKTIHRLLEMDFAPDGSLKFVHDKQNRLEFDLCVIDEMSMVDSALFCSLLEGLPEHCRLVMVGDSDQLPAVGAGNVLRDIINSDACRVVELSHIFRQAAQSLIVTNAHKIVGGELPQLDVRDRDFFFLEANRENAAELVVSLACARLPKSYKLDPLSDIQVLTPTKLGLLGTAALNDRLRQRLNPPAENKAQIKVMGNLLRSGDKVMQTKNNYDIKYVRDGGEGGIGVFNGDIGEIESIDYAMQRVTVKFDDRTVAYTFEQAKQLDAAYAATVHKSQGSEFEAVVLCLSDISRRLRYRNLLYTAVTRAKKLLVIVGESSVLAEMVHNDRKLLRYTGLEGFLKQDGKYEFL